MTDIDTVEKAQEAAKAATEVFRNALPEAPSALPREMFHAVVRFIAPQEGYVTVYAEDIFKARRVLVEQFKNREDFTIVDIYPASSIKPDSQVLDDEDTATEVLSPTGESQAEQLTPGMAERV